MYISTEDHAGRRFRAGGVAGSRVQCLPALDAGHGVCGVGAPRQVSGFKPARGHRKDGEGRDHESHCRQHPRRHAVRLHRHSAAGGAGPDVRAAG